NLTLPAPRGRNFAVVRKDGPEESMKTLATPEQINDQIAQLQNSPIHGLKIVEIREVELALIDKDATNPGGDEFSKRYERRAPDIRESFDILGGIVYPLVICEKSGSSDK